MRVVLHKPSWRKKELRGVRDGLAELEVQSILSRAFGPILLYDDCLMLCNMWGRSRMCGCSAWEISPTLILVPALLNSKTKTNKGSTSWNTGEPKLYFIIIFIISLFIYIFIYLFTNFCIILFFLFCSPNFLNFSITQTRLR